MSPSQPSVWTVVFDLDGTLVETAPDLVATLNAVLARSDLPPVAYADARLMVGAGAKVMIERGLAAAGHTMEPPEHERMFADFIAHYAANIAVGSHVFPGLEAALDRLESQGFQLAVCTNKLEGLSRQLLQALGLTSRFRAIVGQDTYGIQKPDPEVLRRTISAASGDVRRAIMIGDSATDIRTAQALGVPVIAVDFGYTDEPVATFAPDRVIGHFDQLAEAVAQIVQLGPRQ